MRFLLISVGSRGDVEPFCALAQKLVEKGTNQVDFFVQPELEHLVPPSKRIHRHCLPFTQNDFYKYVAFPSHGADHENPRVRFVGVVADVIGELVLPCCNDVVKVAATSSAESCQVIVTSALARSLAFAVGSKMKIPVALIHLQPLAPTDLFPHYGNDAQACLQAIELGKRNETNKETYMELEQYQYDFLKDRLDKTYQTLGMEPLDLGSTLAILSGKHPKIGLCNCFSSELIPVDDQAGATIFRVGALADSYIPDDFDASALEQELVEFLKQKPVAVGYGSMPFENLAVLLEALEQVGKPAVLVGSAMKLPDSSKNDWVTKNVRQIDSAPYAWLLPHCSMMLSHGGAGVLHATLRAGIPAVISPLLGDQFFWAKLVTALGIGVQAGGLLPSVAKDELVEAIHRADECAVKAESFGSAMRSHRPGVDVLSGILEQACAQGGFVFPKK